MVTLCFRKETRDAAMMAVTGSGKQEEEMELKRITLLQVRTTEAQLILLMQIITGTMLTPHRTKLQQMHTGELK